MDACVCNVFIVRMLSSCSFGSFVIPVEFSVVAFRNLKCLMTSSNQAMAPSLSETPPINTSINSPPKVSNRRLDNNINNNIMNELASSLCELASRQYV